MSGVVGKRLEEAIEVAGISQNALARRLKISQSVISDLIRGRNQETKHIVRLARELGQDPEWLAGGDGQLRPRGSTLPSPTASRAARRAPTIVQIEGEEYARLPLYDIRAHAGRGSLAHDGEPVGWRIFDLNWVKTVTRSPLEQLKVIEVFGDSMEPTLYKGDHVLTDLANTALSQHGLFVLRMEESLMVKRIQKKFKTGAVRIISDNPKYEAEEISEPETLAVVGRVIWIGRSVG